MTVHFNLFGGTVLKLGTKKHHDALLEKIGAPRCARKPLQEPPQAQLHLAASDCAA